MGAALVGGGLSGLACGPMELVMIQQQRFGKSLLATPAAIATEGGAAGLHGGLLMACGREGVHTAGARGRARARARSPSRSARARARARIPGI